MTTFGYMIPDPETPHRHSVWITGGKIEPNKDEADVRNWKALFAKHPPKQTLGASARLLAVKFLMGAKVGVVNDDSSFSYEFTRPLGGHGLAYIDEIYTDDSLRIVKGHRGTVFVFSKTKL